MYILGSFEGKRGKSNGTVQDLMNSLKRASTANIVVFRVCSVTIGSQHCPVAKCYSRGVECTWKAKSGESSTCVLWWRKHKHRVLEGGGGIGPQFVIRSDWVGLFFRVGIEFHQFPRVSPLDCLRYVIGIFFGSSTVVPKFCVTDGIPEVVIEVATIHH